jgi:hypothetical protein
MPNAKEHSKFHRALPHTLTLYIRGFTVPFSDNKCVTFSNALKTNFIVLSSLMIFTYQEIIEGSTPLKKAFHWSLS